MQNNGINNKNGSININGNSNINTTNKTVIKISIGTVVVLAAIVLFVISFGKEVDIENKFTGEWYDSTTGLCIVSFGDDFTFDMPLLDEKGTYKLKEDNILELTNLAGEIGLIEYVFNEDGTLLLDDYLLYKQDVIYETKEDTESVKDEQSEIEVSEFAVECRDFSEGKAWIKQKSGNWYCIDVDGNILFGLPKDISPESNYMNGLCLVTSEKISDYNEYTIIDTLGNPVSFDCIGESDSVLLIHKSSNSVCIWIKTLIDSYDGFLVQLKVIDENGKVKAEFFPNDIISEQAMADINKKTAMISMDLEYQGDGVCSFGNSDVYHFDIESQTVFKDIAPIHFERGYGVNRKGELKDKLGNIIASVSINRREGIITGDYNEEVYYLGERQLYKLSYNGKFDGYKGSFYDKDGSIKIDFSDYFVYNRPTYDNGYCVIGLINEIGTVFTGVIDNTGKFVFEPLEAETLCDKVTDNVILVKKQTSNESNAIAIIDLNGNELIVLDEDISTTGKFNDGWALFRRINHRCGYYNKHGDFLKIKVPLDN